MSRAFLTPIVLPADPAVAMEAATKQYVDNAVAGGGGGGSFLPLAGGTLTGPLRIDQSGVLDLTTYPGGDLQIGGNSPSVAPVNTILRGDSIQARTANGNSSWPLILNPLGNAVRVGAHSGTTIDPSLQLLGPLPTGCPLRIYGGGQQIGQIMPFGSVLPADLVIQTVGGASISNNIAIQSANGEINCSSSGATTFVTGGSERFRVRTGPSGECLTLGGNPSAYMYFREASPSGTVHGYVGADATWGMRLTASARDALLHSANGATRVQASDYVDIFSGGTYTARFGTAGQFFVQRQTQDDTLAGMHWHTVWCSLRTTCNIDQAASLYLDKRGAGTGVGQEFLRMDMTEVKVGSITRTSGGVAYNTTSDYRIKDVQGPITDGLDRLRMLKPVRAVYHADEEQREVDAFVAHEVAEAVPEAVTGTKDAVVETDDHPSGSRKGTIIPQMLDNSRLIPLLVAAVQELADEVESLKGAA